MTTSPGALDVVTGAFSYSGAAIARELRAAGRQVRTLTGHPAHAPTGRGAAAELPRPRRADPIDARSAHALQHLLGPLRHGSIDHDAAVANSQALFHAAAAAGIQRIVHVSITHSSSDSPYPYFRGKARVEEILGETGVSHAIVRPAILFGGSGVLINNVAWLLRHVPIFAVSGHGTYRVRGIHIDDLARLCVSLGARGVRLRQR